MAVPNVPAKLCARRRRRPGSRSRCWRSSPSWSAGPGWCSPGAVTVMASALLWPAMKPDHQLVGHGWRRLPPRPPTCRCWRSRPTRPRGLWSPPRRTPVPRRRSRRPRPVDGDGRRRIGVGRVPQLAVRVVARDVVGADPGPGVAGRVGDRGQVIGGPGVLAGREHEQVTGRGGRREGAAERGGRACLGGRCRLHEGRGRGRSPGSR